MKIKLLFFSVLFAFVLTGCNFGQTTATSTPVPTQAVTETPAPTAPLVPTTLSEAYPEKLRDDIYSVILPAVSSDYAIEEGELRDGYVLLHLRNIYESEHKTLVLFPLYQPGLAKTFEISENYSIYKLSEAGKIIEALPEKGILNIYSDSFELADSVNTDIRSLTDCDSAGRIWYLNASGFICYYDTLTKETKAFDSCSYKICSSILHEEADSLWFLVRGNAPFEFPVQISLSSDEITEASFYQLTPEIYGPVASYNSQSSWYFAYVNDLSKLYSFRKENLNENLCRSNEKTAISALCQSTLEGDIIYYSDEYRAFRLENGGTVSTLTTSLFDNRTSIRLLTLSSNDMVLFTASKDDKQSLFIWDFSETSAEKKPSFHTIDANDFNREIASKAASLEEKYGVEIYYDDESLLNVTCYYDMFASTDSIALLNSLEELERCMAEYPENFFRETLGTTRSALEIYLSDGFRPLYMDQVQHPTSFVTVRENSLVLCIDLNHAQSGYSSTFAHELMHIMEYRINEYATNSKKDILTYWNLSLNSPDYDYFFQTVDAEGHELTDPTATAKGGDPDAWFIDTYGRSDPLEDRARIIEYMYLQKAELFESENLKAKGRFLISVIREVFPSIGSCTEPVLWEKLLGTDGPAFSDYDFPELVPFG